MAVDDLWATLPDDPASVHHHDPTSRPKRIADAEIDSARDLGATPAVVLRDIIIPRARGGIMAGFSLCFLIAVGDYLTPQLGGGKMALFGQLIAPQFGMFFNWPLGAAMSFSIFGISLGVLAVINLLFWSIGRPA